MLICSLGLVRNPCPRQGIFETLSGIENRITGKKSVAAAKVTAQFITGEL
jgi:hypothetical protein